MDEGGCLAAAQLGGGLVHRVEHEAAQLLFGPSGGAEHLGVFGADHEHRRLLLYTPEQEANGTIKCTGSCLSFWFPVTVANGGTPHAGSGLTGKLGSIQRPDDGSSQVTYNGEPLYTFKLDSGPGQAHGNDFTDSFGGQSFLWHAATASGTAPAPAPSSNPTGVTYQGGAGGY